MAVRQRKKTKKQPPQGASSSAAGKSNNNSNNMCTGNATDTNGGRGSGSSLSSSWKASWKLFAAVAVIFAGGLLVLLLYLFSNVFESSSSLSSSAALPTTIPSASPSNTPSTLPTNTPSASPTTNAPSSSPPSQQPSSKPVTEPPPPLYSKRGSFTVLERWPHDPAAFCQGLEVKNATHLYESIGLYTQSAMRIVDIVTGDVTWENTMPDEMFGEGVTLVTSSSNDPFLLQLTWNERTAFLYDPETLQEISRMPYATTNGQGWGIAYDTHQENIVYVTDGTEFIHTWKLTMGDDNQLSYEQIARTPVTFDFGAGQGVQTLRQINELEYDPHTKSLVANIFLQDVIVRIDPKTGFTTRVYDFSSLYINRDPSADVLNGVALVPGEPGRFYVTGKLWPTLYKVELVDLD